MTDKKFVHNFLNKNYRIGCSDTALSCYCIKTKKHYSFVALWSEVARILGEFATHEIVDEWYKFEQNNTRKLIDYNLEKIDITLNSFVLSHEFARNLRYTGLTKTYLDTVFAPYYIKKKFNNNHKELFKEFDLQLGKNKWDVFWCGQTITPEKLIKLSESNPFMIRDKIIVDFIVWYKQAIEEECEKLIKNLYN